MSHPLVAEPLDVWIDPETLYLALFATLEHSFWLDAGPDATTGWSWIGTGDRADDPAVVRDVACAGAGASSPEGRFGGGWVGWLGYEPGAARAGAPTADPGDDVPSDLWLRAERLVAFDHTARKAYAFACGEEVADFARSVRAAVRHPVPPLHAAPAPVSVLARHEPDQYEALIERCRDAIREGDAYQLCLTTRFAVEASVDPLESYRRLRSRTPAHHGGLIRSGSVALLSASPELFLEVGDGIVRTHPIKGTRPRGTDGATDAALAAELAASEKERAENVMIVDLMRNDLSRVCLDGTVAVERLFAIESYPAVHQLVSTVSGTLEDDVTVGRLLDAAFPAGSMTGAPKLSAMTILHDLEGGPRGVFSGCFGWIGDDGALDLAMIIRSIVVHSHGAYVGAGGGITWRSDAAAEVAEVGVKARGPLGALGATLPPGW
ncbi:anthranilate synthase component I family protein [Microbacterium sp. 4R-513]|uniref:anthranilate synthase component I family protein n=1 Tax=Microbacterium sp. 4R-513 TaxID=2567934 RepID=UPI0013E1C2F9|nr:anthranilate synthase component I family protein [Microbacterium sp. 4R-513]QIG40582.1 anthranilate synthase component I family protein [Microbacterium sp. 4R-513]